MKLEKRGAGGLWVLLFATILIFSYVQFSEAAIFDGTIEPWTTSASVLPVGRSSHSTIEANGYVYVIGGAPYGGPIKSTVYYAKLNSDGSTGAWITNVNALPAARMYHSSVVANGYVYVIGGTDGTVRSTVYYAKLDNDGSIGEWATSSSALPTARNAHTSVVANGYVYVIRGISASGIQSTVLFAKLNSDGSLGAWQTSPNPIVRYSHSSVVANGYVYVIGGYKDGSSAGVFYAKLNSDGTTGGWAIGTNLLGNRWAHTSVVANGYVYVLGGKGAGPADTVVWYAKLNSNGSIGPWLRNVNVLPAARIYHTSIVANGYVYVIGGSAANTVFYAKFSSVDETTPPATLVSFFGTTGTNDWYTSSVNITLSATDDPGGSGVKETRVCVDQVNTCIPAVGTTATISAEGTNYLRYFSIDNANNQESIQLAIVKIDVTNPSIPIVESMPQYSNQDPQTVTWQASTDAVSGINQYKVFSCSVTGSTDTCVPSTLPNTSFLTGFLDSSSKLDNSRYFYSVKSVDNAGLESPSSNIVSVVIDKSAPTPPSLSALSLTGFVNLPPAILSWTASQDPGVLASGLRKYNVFKGVVSKVLDVLSDTAANILTYSDSALTEGIRDFYAISATDNANNEGIRSNEESVVLDQTKPITTLTTIPSSPDGLNGWYKSSFGVALACSDLGGGETSGCQAGGTKYSLNNGSISTYSGIFLTEGDGTYLIKYFSLDNAENMENERAQTEKIDQTMPEISVNVLPAQTNNPSMEVSGVATDLTSGVASLAINGQSVVIDPSSGNYSYTFTLADGPNDITIIVMDAAGNTSTISDLSVVLDRAAPETTISSAIDDKGAPVPSGGIISSEITLTFEGVDNLTPSASLEFDCSLDGVYASCVSPLKYTALASGNHIFTVQAIDVAGNVDATPASFSFSFSRDADNDGIDDVTDSCPNVVGIKEYNGCPFADKTIVDLQIVDQQKSGICGILPDGKPRGECKKPLVGAEVKIFDREDLDFISLFSKRPSKLLLDKIFGSDIGKVGSCTTDSTGTCLVGEDHPGKFLVVTKFVDGSNTVYTGKFKNFKGSVINAYQDEEDDSDIDDIKPSNTILTKKLHILKTVKNNGEVTFYAAKMTIVSGSELDVIHPEYTIWDGDTVLYPFVMTSNEEWTTDICLQVPQGYKITGVMDEDGNIVAKTSCAESFIAGETKVLLFSAVEIGSPEPNFSFSLSATHKGKKSSQRVSIEGIRRETKIVNDKELGDKIEKARQTIEDRVNKQKGSKRIVSDGKSVLFHDSLWAIVKDTLGAGLHNDIIKEATKEIAKANSINIPEWGINGGKMDARKLMMGLIINIESLLNFSVRR